MFFVKGKWGSKGCYCCCFGTAAAAVLGLLLLLLWAAAAAAAAALLQQKGKRERVLGSLNEEREREFIK